MQLIVEPIWPWPIVSLIGAGLVAVVLATYPARVRHLSAARRRALIGLRLLTAIMLVFAMLRPAVRFSETDTQSAEMVILTDQSASMATPDGPGGITRRAALLRTLSEAAGPLARLEEQVDIRFIDFAELTSVVEHPGDVADGNYTAIGAAVDELRQEDTGRRLVGVVLMSDGAQRAVAPNDVDALSAARQFAEQIGVPIHPVPFGTSDLSTAGLDLGVEDIVGDAVTFEKKTVPFRVQLRLLGAAGRTVTVRLLQEDRTGKRSGESGELKPVPYLSGATPSRELTVPDNDESTTLDLSLVAERPGEYKIAVEVVPLEGELKLTNNLLETLLTVRKGGLKVAYFDALGRNESKFVEQLNRTAKIQFDWQVLLPGALASRTEISPKWFEPGQYDVFIIGDVPASAFRRGQTDLLSRLADRLRDGAGLLMLGGKHNYAAGGYADTPLADFLPVVMNPADRRPDDTIDPAQFYDRRLPMVPTRSGVALHYVMNIDPRDNAGAWAKLPELDGANRLTPKLGATVLAETPDHIPLLVATDTGTARVMASAVDSTWLWHMHGFREEHQRFWQQMILWLARKEQEGDQPVWVQV
ncbi:MAG: glutamine amidotransferase, partial [Planctomycetaceae bacterium]